MRKLLILACAILLTGPALAFAGATPSENMANTNAPDDAQKNPAGKFIQDLGDRAIAAIADKSLPQNERTQKYRDLLQSSFDMPAIAHFVVGRAWNNASDQQRQEYMDLFQKVVIKTYGDRLNLYSGEGFHVKGARAESDKDTIINSEITHADGSNSTKVDWRVRNNNGKYAVVDVVVEGVSQSITQRDEYSSIIQRDGGKLDGLISLMRKQLQDNGGAQQEQQDQ